MTDTPKPMAKRILVVDDEQAICQMVGKVLKTEGYDPAVYTLPSKALAASEETPFDFAFLDIRLPEMNGLELAERLKEHNPALEVVFMTGYGTIENAVQAIKVGAYDFLRKPFNLSEIRLCVKRFEEREALKERIRVAEGRYSHLVQHLPILIFVLGRDFRLDFVNDACSIVLGYTPQEALSTPHWLFDRIHSEDRERIKALFHSAFDSPEGLSFSTECRFVHKKGQLIYTIIKSIPRLENEQEEKTDHLEGILVDITDRVLLEKTLVQREKLKTLGAISAEVAHEIRNPLVSLGGFARRLQKKFPQTPEIDIILNESQRLEKILDRIKNYLKPVEIRPQECSVNTLLTNCINLLSPELDSKEVMYCLDLDTQLSQTYVDPDILSEVFIILIRKGKAIMSKEGTLTIKTFESDRNIHIQFSSQTEGKIRDAEQLFLPFDEGGQSIGLPLAYRLMKNMGGLLSFTQDENHVIFTVILPKTGQGDL